MGTEFCSVVSVDFSFSIESWYLPCWLSSIASVTVSYT